MSTKWPLGSRESMHEAREEYWLACLQVDRRRALSTGRYVPDEAKRAREVLSGFCDAAGKLTPKADATHVGWSLVA